MGLVGPSAGRASPACWMRAPAPRRTDAAAFSSTGLAWSGLVRNPPKGGDRSSGADAWRSGRSADPSAGPSASAASCWLSSASARRIWSRSCRFTSDLEASRIFRSSSSALRNSKRPPGTGLRPSPMAPSTCECRLRDCPASFWMLCDTKSVASGDRTRVWFSRTMSRLLRDMVSPSRSTFSTMCSRCRASTRSLCSKSFAFSERSNRSVRDCSSDSFVRCWTFAWYARYLVTLLTISCRSRRSCSTC